MNRIKMTVAALSAFAVILASGIRTSDAAHAATKEDVISAAYEAGFSESYIQQGMNFLETNTYTPEQYDQMVALVLSYRGRTDEAIKLYLDQKGTPDTSESESSSEEQNSGVSEENSQSNGASENTQNTGNTAAPAESASQNRDFSSMSEQEQNEYIENMPQAEKNQILKDLDRETQLEIINSMIDASSALGMNVSLDSLTKDKIEYSIRNNDGDVVDISSIGVIVDDTGIDYTALYLTASGTVLAAAAGIILIARSLRKGNERI